MARKSRGRKRKAKKKSAKAAVSKATSAPNNKKVEAEAGTVSDDEVVEADVVIAAAPKQSPPPTLVPVIRPAEVVEIRPAEEAAAASVPLVDPDPVLKDDDLSLGEWDEPEFHEHPRPPKEKVPEEAEQSIQELQELQSELDAMLSSDDLINAPPIIDEESAEPERKRVHRFERKLQPASRLPTDLDSESEAEESAGKGFMDPPKTMPPMAEGSPWSGERAGGEGAPEKFYGRKNVLSVIEDIPLIGRLLVDDGAWRPLVIFVAVFSLINALIFWLVLSLMVDEEDRLRSVNVGTIPEERAKSVPMDEIKGVVRNFVVSATWEEKLKHVRAAGHVVEKLRDYYKSHPVVMGDDVTVERAERVSVNGLDLFKIEATILPEKDILVLMLERDPRGYLKVDWEVAVDYQEMPWQAFYDGQISEPTNLRVAFRLKDPPYHNFQFADAVQFRGYRLWYPDSDLPELIGYVDRGSDIDKALEGLLSGDGGGQRSAILSVAFPEEAKDPSMVRIVDLVSVGWVRDYERAAHTSDN